MTRLDGKHLALIQAFKLTLPPSEVPSRAVLKNKSPAKDNEEVQGVGELEHFHFIRAIMRRVLTRLRVLFAGCRMNRHRSGFGAISLSPFNVALLLSLSGRKFGVYIASTLAISAVAEAVQEISHTR